ncbi:DUF3107 domain-containing protein [Actinotalea sp.]|uniref:DUF3107 domain-containing protein n=1 Tax=Actinotalea sp. TaxID=1872145 RepID=UPI00356B3223
MPTDNDEGIDVDITIGMRDVARELLLESDLTSEAVTKQVLKALEVGAPIELADSKGRKVIVPASALGYIEIGSDQERRVGFHNL